MYARLPFGATPAGHMFQKTDEIFKELQNVFGITDVFLLQNMLMMAQNIMQSTPDVQKRKYKLNR